MIHANTIGNMVGEHEAKTWYNECPRCGGDKHHDAKQCKACRDEERRSQPPAERDDATRERQQLFNAALDSGRWTIEEVMLLARERRLRGAWLCFAWWVATDPKRRV